MKAILIIKLAMGFTCSAEMPLQDAFELYLYQVRHGFSPYSYEIVREDMPNYQEMARRCEVMRAAAR